MKEKKNRPVFCGQEDERLKIYAYLKMLAKLKVHDIVKVIVKGPS